MRQPQRQDHFAVRGGAEGVNAIELLADRLVVVDFAVYRQRLPATLAEDRLRAGIDIDDCQALVCQDGLGRGVYPAPVRAAVAHQPRLAQRHLPNYFQILAQVQHAENRAHPRIP